MATRLFQIKKRVRRQIRRDCGFFILRNAAEDDRAARNRLRDDRKRLVRSVGDADLNPTRRLRRGLAGNNDVEIPRRNRRFILSS